MLAPLTDRIQLGDALYARNSSGLHVPVEALTVEEQNAAPRWLDLVTAAQLSSTYSRAPTHS